jgi:hypothetical protein
MKAIVAVAAVAILALAIGVAAPASAVPFNQADFSGYASGNLLFAKALTSGTGTPDEVMLANVTEGFTGSAVDSNGIKTIHNEMNRLVVAGNAAKKTAGRGSAVELGIAKGPDDLNDLELFKAEVQAPPDAADSNELTGDEPLSISPLVYASVLRGAAVANWSNTATCVLGEDLSSGLGYVADVQLLEGGETNEDGTFGAPVVATDAPSPDRAVAHTFSHEFLDVQQTKAGKPLGLKFGLSSQVRQTIAPITLFKGTPQQITIEVGGEWILEATAGGVPGSAFIRHGVGEVGSQVPLLKILDADNAILEELDLHDIPIFPPEGLEVNIPGVISLVIGEDPRPIGDYDGTHLAPADPKGLSASAAADVVRIIAIDGQLADIRVGHAEVKAQVPEGGIDCGIPVTKSASPKGVTVNQNFVVTIKIDNPFGCDLNHVKVTDDITTQGDAKFQVVDTNPNANQVPAGSNLDSGKIVWNDIGSIPKGGTKSVTTTIKAQGGGGIITDIAHVSATAGNCDGEGEGNNLVGNSRPLKVPVVLKLKLPPTGVGTSTATMIGALALLSLAGVAIRQLRRNA